MTPALFLLREDVRDGQRASGRSRWTFHHSAWELGRISSQDPAVAQLFDCLATIQAGSVFENKKDDV